MRPALAATLASASVNPLELSLSSLMVLILSFARARIRCSLFESSGVLKGFPSRAVQVIYCTTGHYLSTILLTNSNAMCDFKIVRGHQNQEGLDN